MKRNLRRQADALTTKKATAKMHFRYHYDRLELSFSKSRSRFELFMFPSNLNNILNRFEDVLKDKQIVITCITYFESEYVCNVADFIKEHAIQNIEVVNDNLLLTNYEGLKTLAEHEDVLVEGHLVFHARKTRDSVGPEILFNGVNGKNNDSFGDKCISIDLHDNEMAEIVTDNDEMIYSVINESIKDFVLNHVCADNYYKKKKRKYRKKVSKIELINMDVSIIEDIISVANGGITMFVKELEMNKDIIALKLWHGHTSDFAGNNDTIYDKKKYHLLEYDTKNKEWRMSKYKIGAPPRAKTFYLGFHIFPAKILTLIGSQCLRFQK